MTDTTRIRLREATDVALRIGFPIILGVSGWTFTSIQDHEARLTAVEVRSETKSMEVDRRLSRLDEKLERLLDVVTRIEGKLR